MFSTTLLLTILGALIADSALARGTNDDNAGLATGAIVAIVVGEAFSHPFHRRSI